MFDLNSIKEPIEKINSTLEEVVTEMKRENLVLRDLLDMKKVELDILKKNCKLK